MKTVEIFNREAQNYTLLEEFILTTKEWAEFESGTKAIRVKTYNSDGKLVDRGYVLRDINNVDEVFAKMRAVSEGYYTVSSCAIRN